MEGVQGFLTLGWIHQANQRGLAWMCQQLGLQLHSLSHSDEIQRFAGKWIVLSLDRLIANTDASKLIISGPHLFPHDMPPDRDIDSTVIFNTLSPWVKNFIHGARPSLHCICAPFPLPFDTLVPKPDVLRTDLVLYFKHRDAGLLPVCRQVLEKQYPTATIHVFQYGQYHINHWLDTLQKAQFAVFVIGTESQGFAVQEAMSLNVPIVMWDVQYLHDVSIGADRWFERMEYASIVPATGVPLWSPQCGVRVASLSALEKALAEMPGQIRAGVFAPRQFIMGELSAEQCYQRFVQNHPGFHLKERYLVMDYPIHQWTGGLGDRLVGLVSAILLSRKSCRTLLIRWKSPDMSHVWTNLCPYTEDHADQLDRDMAADQVLSWDCIDDRFRFQNVLSTQPLSVVWPKRWVFLKCNQEIASFAYGGDNRQFQADARCAYRELFTKYFRLHSDFAADKLFPLASSCSKKRIGLQIRAGDVHMGCGNDVLFTETALQHHIIPHCAAYVRQHWPPLEYDVVFTSDNPCIDAVRRCFADYTVLYNDGQITHLERQGDPDGIRKLMRDLCTLRECHSLIFTWNSNFGRLAALMMGETADVHALSLDGTIAPVSSEDFGLLFTKHSVKAHDHVTPLSKSNGTSQ